MNPKEGTSSQVTWGSLINGVCADIGRLFAHDLQLAKLEIREGTSRAKSALIALAIGAFLGAVGALMLLHALVYLLNVTTTIPLWGCYGMVGVTVIGIGIILLLVARNKATRIDMTPQRAAEAFKEDWAWMTSTISKSWHSVNRPEPH